MSVFSEFEQNEAQLIKSRLDALYGKTIIQNQAHHYFDVFNHDCRLINQLLSETTQETLFQRKAYECQEDYNEALVSAKVRWGVSDKEYHSGVLLIKDLSAKKRNYDKSMEEMKTYESKMQLLEGYSKDIQSQHAPWARLQRLVNDDPKACDKLKEIQQAWLAQGSLSKGNISDILKLINALEHMKALLDFFASKIDENSNLVIDRKIKAMITSNRQILITNHQQCINALGWRLRAAALSNNLRCDDSLFALTKELQNTVLQDVSQNKLVEVSDLLVISHQVKTFEMNFEDFAQALKLVQNAADKTWYHKWLASNWVKNEDHQNLIEVIVQDDVVVPAKLAALVPHSIVFTPDSWFRYWFFRNTQPLSWFWRALHRKLAGNYNETLTFINETYRQVNHFEQLLQSFKEQGFGLNLNYISSSPAFMAALSLPRLLNYESRRGELMRPSRFIGYFLRKIPFLNRFASYQFFSVWRTEISNARRIIALKYRNIAKTIVEDYESLLLSSIMSKSFSFHKGLINDLEKFIRIYGLQEDIDKFNRISDPIFILQKFDFLLNEKNEDMRRALNEDAVITFVNFAQKYWPAEKIEAIKAIVNIINRSSIPRNESEDKQLMTKIACLLNHDNRQQAFESLMNMIATKYLFTTGDDGTSTTFDFLKRFAPQAYENWKMNRQMAIEEKFILINKILLDGQKKELELDSKHVYEVGNLALKYNQYGAYLNDIRQSDSLNQTQNELLLIKQAQRYISAYQGDNSLYADFMVKLLVPSQLVLLKEYATKRFSYLMKEFAQNDQLIQFADFEFVRQISLQPQIVDALISIMQKEYNGENLAMAEIILTINQPRVNAIYFGKYFEYLLDKKNYTQLLLEKENFYQYCSHDEFLRICSDALSKVIDKLQLNEQWHHLESADFNSIIETFGTLQNKESYRLLRVRRLLEKSNSDETKAYLSSVSSNLNGTLQNNLITLQDMRVTLDDILNDRVQQLLQNQQWEGHTQYFLEFFLSSEKKYLLYDMRVQWLCDYLAHPKRFADENALERSYMEAKFHYQNKDVPNDEIDLETFYGKSNARRIKEIILGNLENIENPMRDEQIVLMRRYLKDNLFCLDGKGPFYYKKFEIYQKMLKILRMIADGDYQSAIKNTEHFVDEIKGLEEINESSPKCEREDIINYDKKMLSMLTSSFEKKYRELILTKEVIDADVIDQPAILKKIDQERKSLNTGIAQSNLPQALKTAIQDISQKEERVAIRVINFTNTLNFKTLHLINLNIDLANLFNRYLSDNTKQYLLKRMDLVKAYLSADDILHNALCAYQKIIEGKSDEMSYQRDMKIIERYRAKQRDYTLMADNVASKLSLTLEQRMPLAQCRLFNELKGSYQNAFINDISLDVKKSLLSALQKRIEQMADQNEAVTLIDRVDWLKHGKLLAWLTMTDSDDEKKVKNKIQKLVNDCLEEAKKSLQVLIDKYDNVLLDKKGAFKKIGEAPTYYPSQEVLQQEKSLLKQGLFIRAFGDESQKKALDKVLAEVAKRQRKVMMNALSGPFVEHCLDYAHSLLCLSGSNKQRLECIHLIDTWNRYRAMNIADVRSVAIVDAIPQYITDFDNAIFQYFIKKHNLRETFTQLMLDKMEQWQLTEELIEPNRLLKNHPIAEFKQILVEEAQGQKHGMLYSAPSMNDAEKLFVAFCLALQAHQLAKIWEKRQAQNPTGLRSFKPDDISEPLSVMVKTLSKKFDIGRNRFNESIAKAIHKDKENFASWSSIELSQAREKPSVKEKLRV